MHNPAMPIRTKRHRDEEHSEQTTIFNRLSKLFLSAHPKCRECLFSLFCPFLYSDTSKTRFKAQKAIAFPFASYTLFDKKL